MTHFFVTVGEMFYEYGYCWNLEIFVYCFGWLDFFDLLLTTSLVTVSGWR